MLENGVLLSYTKQQYWLSTEMHGDNQEGWLSPTERASVSAISLRHILASPEFAPGTIAVNVTWMERVFNAGQKNSSMYPLSSTVYEL